jgi:hypothetical protein
VEIGAARGVDREPLARIRQRAEVKAAERELVDKEIAVLPLQERLRAARQKAEAVGGAADALSRYTIVKRAIQPE